MRANVLVAVRNGTFGDQGFDEEDDDSFISVDTAESDGKVICILRHMPNPIDVIDAEENVILPIPMAVDLPNPLDNIDIVENVVILPPPIAVCEPRDEPIGFNNINIDENHTTTVVAYEDDSTIVSDEDDPSYSVDEWYDCQQDDDAISGPDNDVNASNSSASSNPL